MRLHEFKQINIPQKLNDWINDSSPNRWKKMEKEMDEILNNWDGQGTHPFIQMIEENNRVIFG